MLPPIQQPNRPKRPAPSSGTTVANGFPVPNGTYAANPFPTTAQNGPQGVFGASLPTVNVGGNGTNPIFPQTPLTPKGGGRGTILPTAQDYSQYRQTFSGVTGVAPVGYGNNASQPSLQSTTPKYEGRGDPAMRALVTSVQNAAMDKDKFVSSWEINGAPDYSLLPKELNLMQIKANNWDAKTLAIMGYVQDPETLKYVQQNQPGGQQGVDAQGNTVSAGDLRYGQYIDSQGRLQYGTTRFGVNAQGQRLDASGNVWDPSDPDNQPTRDIYGGEFVQKGETQWVTYKGKRVKIRAGYGSVKEQLYQQNKRKREKERRKKRAWKRAQQEKQQQQGDPIEVSGNLNTATG